MVKIIFISINTPTKTKVIEAGKANDIKWFEVYAWQKAKYAQDYTINHCREKYFTCNNIRINKKNS